MKTILILGSILFSGAVYAQDCAHEFDSIYQISKVIKVMKITGKEAKIEFDKLPETQAIEILPQDYSREVRKAQGIECEKISDMMYGASDEYLCTLRKEQE